MSEPFIGQIMLFGFNYPPVDFAFCNGASILVAQNPALYSLIGPTFGTSGSGSSQTYKIPNLTGLVIAGLGIGPGSGINWVSGMTKGAESVMLNSASYPMHNHVLSQQAVTSTEGVPVAGHCLSTIAQAKGAVPISDANTTFANSFFTPVGQAAPAAHDNCQASLSLNFCISLSGEYPSFP